MPGISPLFLHPPDYTLDPELPQIGLIKDATNASAYWLLLIIGEPITRTCQPKNGIMDLIAPSVPDLGGTDFRDILKLKHFEW